MCFQKLEKNNPNNTALRAFFFAFLVLIVLNLPTQSFAATCGDGVCEAGGVENSCTCQQDCGTCGGVISNVACKEFSCLNNICLPTFIPNCCGNTTCESGEAYANCPVDCEPTSLELEILSPQTNETFFLGDTISIKVEASSSGRSGAASDINVTGFFGFLRLFNDGKHDDNSTFDRIFANKLVVSDLNAGFYDLNFHGTFRGIQSTLNRRINVQTKLTTDFEIKPKFKRGETITGKGKVFKGISTAAIPLTVGIFSGEKEIIKDIIQSDSNGSFAFNYQTSLIDDLGQWSVKIFGEDENHNSLEIEKSFLLLAETAKDELFISIAKDLKEEIKRGENFELFVQVTDDKNNLVGGATVFAETPFGEKISFNEVQNGVYETFFRVPPRLSLGEQVFTIIASKEGPDFSAEGELVVVQKIGSAVMETKILEPKESYYKIGETMPVLIKIIYSSQEPVLGATVKMLLNEKEYNLEPVEEGLYQTQVYITDKDYGELELSFKIEDGFGNESFTQSTITIAQRTAVFELLENPVISAIIFLVLIIAGAFIILPFFSVFSSYNLQQKRKKLIKQKELLQKQYFDNAIVDKNFYEQRLRAINNELEITDDALKRLKK